MTDNEFLSLLNEIGFPDRYWSLCERFPVDLSIKGKAGTKKDIVAAFREVDVIPECPEANAYFCEREVIGGMEWSATFCKQRSGLELMIDGESKDGCVGSNFAVLAYEAKQLADPLFKRDPFKGPPPYPRPDHNGDAAALKEIIKEFVLIVRSIKSAIRSKCEDQPCEL